MRSVTYLALALTGACLCGCKAGGGLERVDDQKQPFNRWTIQTLDDDSISNAIITQHTLYPYHFMTGSADLNELGERDVKVLAGHMAKYPGQINVRRGGEDPTLYDARVQALTKMLARLGVPETSIKIADGMPGGDGISTDRAVLILKRSYESRPLMGDSTSSGGSDKNSGGSGNGSSGSAPQGGNQQ